jgi:hypothetical protein
VRACPKRAQKSQKKKNKKDFFYCIFFSFKNLNLILQILCKVNFLLFSFFLSFWFLINLFFLYLLLWAVSFRFQMVLVEF